MIVLSLDPSDADQLTVALRLLRRRCLKDRTPLRPGIRALEQAVSAEVHRSDGGTPWLTLDQAAERAHVSVRTLRRWRANGLPSSTVGNRVLIARDDLDNYLSNPSDMAGHSDAEAA